MTISKPHQKKYRKEAEFNKFIDQSENKPGRRAVQISLQIPIHLLDAIDERSQSLGISRAAFIKQASAIYLENN